MSHDKRPVSLEDLLRLKRAERPPAEFWTQFDRELRAKQLAALVERRPWWRFAPDTLRRFARFQLPIGASAVLAISFVTLRDSSVGPDARVESAHIGMVAEPVASYASMPTSAEAVGQDVLAVISPEGLRNLSQSSEDRDLLPATTVALSEPARGESRVSGGLVTTEPVSLSSSIPLLGGSAQAVLVESSPSARSIAANLEAAQEFAAGLLRASHGFESRAMPARAAAVEPLQQITPPGEARRSRYLTAMVAAASDDSIERTSARMAHRISGEELYEQVRRFGTRQGGLNVKF